jgi:uncharacterized protein YjbI with pentapeptide repeats
MNPDHVKLAKQGRDAIAAWRKVHPGDRLDLRGADLYGANLSACVLEYFDLTEANLQEADLGGSRIEFCRLQRANLRGANLHRSILRVAMMSGANLEGANLEGINLHGAHQENDEDSDEVELDGANLIGARLYRANLYRADLSGADLRRADLREANLCEADLRGADFRDVITDALTVFTNASFSNTTRGMPFSLDHAAAITRSIEFPPAYRQAGLGILAYFSEVLHHKSPDIQATVRIEQENLIVRLVILTDEGYRETVEQTLDAYGRVVIGRMPPEALFSDPFQLMELRHRLERSTSDAKYAYELLRMRDQLGQQQQARITSLERELAELLQLVGESLRHEHQVSTQLVTGHVQQTHDLTRMLTALVDELTAQQAELPLASQQQAQLTEALQTLRGELVAPQPNRTALQQAFATARNVLENAAGDMLADVIPKLIAVGAALGLG